jgi:serpin B
MTGILVGCSSEEPGVKQSEVEILASPEYTSAITLNENENSINDAINAFAFDAFARAACDNANEDGNFSFSPLSTTLCMGLLANTVDEATTASIERMYGNVSLEELNSTCYKLMRYLPHKNNGINLSIANSVWVDTTFIMPASYVKNINSVFNAEVYSFDFKRHDLTAMMNYWCSAKTNNKINDVIDDASQASLYIFNALYFDGAWSDPFDKSETVKATFHGVKKNSTIDMMTQTNDYDYYCLNNCAVVALPFNGDKCDMLLILPSDEDDIDSFVKSLGYDMFNNIMSTKSRTSMTVQVPKFTMEHQFEMTQLLADMGLDPNGVEFTKAGIHSSINICVRHNTYISLDEDGAKLAATTVVKGDTANPTSRNIRFDRPFVYLVRNKITGTILMAGCVRNI